VVVYPAFDSISSKISEGEEWSVVERVCVSIKVNRIEVTETRRDRWVTPFAFPSSLLEASLALLHSSSVASARKKGVARLAGVSDDYTPFHPPLCWEDCVLEKFYLDTPSLSLSWSGTWDWDDMMDDERTKEKKKEKNEEEEEERGKLTEILKLLQDAISKQIVYKKYFHFKEKN
jgi:hypothetical protein